MYVCVCMCEREGVIAVPVGAPGPCVYVDTAYVGSNQRSHRHVCMYVCMRGSSCVSR
jgi:hypothetical protein